VNSPSRTGFARALSKLGYCSRSQAWELIKAGRVRLNGRVERDPEFPVNKLGRDQITVDGRTVAAAAKRYLMLNKPRGLVTTSSDEQGRETVLQCLPGLRVFPVGRLDMASEGLLLFTNDTAWAGRITDPASHLDKTYHVQVDCLADEALVQHLLDGVQSEGELLAVKNARVLRSGTKTSWLEIVLDEGKNRHLRRLLAALGVQVRRLVRVAIGPLPLGNLGKGQHRELTPTEVRKLTKLTHEKASDSQLLAAQLGREELT